MIGYVTLGTSNFEAATEFYDKLLENVGIKRFWTHGTMAAWGRSREEPALVVTLPNNGETATVGNSVMVALKLESREDVVKLHAAGLDLGGANEGEPGPRGEHGFYGAYIRDLDGNKLSAYVPAG